MRVWSEKEEMYLDGKLPNIDRNYRNVLRSRIRAKVRDMIDALDKVNEPSLLDAYTVMKIQDISERFSKLFPVDYDNEGDNESEPNGELDDKLENEMEAI